MNQVKSQKSTFLSHAALWTGSSHDCLKSPYFCHTFSNISPKLLWNVFEHEEAKSVTDDWSSKTFKLLFLIRGFQADFLKIWQKHLVRTWCVAIITFLCQHFAIYLNLKFGLPCSTLKTILLFFSLKIVKIRFF